MTRSERASPKSLTALEGKIKAYYIMGEDPLQTEADLGLVRDGFAALDFVVVQDIFMTKTAEMADVILPATSRGSMAAYSPAPIVASSVSTKPSNLPAT